MNTINTTRHITTHSIKEAWNLADELFPCDYIHDSSRTQRAGYDIYMSTNPEIYAWISDLGDRLELNLSDGSTINVWIEEEGEIAEADMNAAICEAVQAEMDAEAVTLADAGQGCVWDESGAEVMPERETLAIWKEGSEAVERMRIEPLYSPEVCQRVTLVIDGDYGTADEKKVFDAIQHDAPGILFQLVTRYAEAHGIRWGGIWGCKASHYSHGRPEEGKKGHYIIDGYISGRVGEGLSFLANCADILSEKEG